ncbi:histone-lysine N-methyltransferase, H3 lysine-9 specific SUVH1-like [Hibiscus syriacus]|uniref:histone-lysine N-methyltransferase, H3 lysine-9 specific SUVH1-like n=1 Tax=Hibiscus syriacus TaxID=106335 RepID=UPI0019212595|nr:histone-lysine N-methyltransferase, H3 lysine-9 specific SUVH1-like [Hibiscus syriacus]
MEGVMGGNTAQTSSINKSQVLDVKPVRTLVPIFPGPSEGAPFVCVSPNGPFPSGFSPFFPFSGSSPNQNGVNPTASPIRPFTVEPSNGQNVSPMAAHGNQGQKPATPMAAHVNQGQKPATPMAAHGNQGQKPATPVVDGHGNPIKKRGRGRPRTRFP